MTPVLKGFVQVGHGQVHYRYGGRGPVVVLLHDAPRSSLVYGPTIGWLGEHFTVVAVDLPAYGGSTPLPETSRTVPGFAAALAETLSALGIERCALYGTQASAAIALQFAADHPNRATLTLIGGLSLRSAPSDEAFIARFCEPIAPEADGSHLPRIWSRVLDLHRHAPWFDRTAEARLSRPLPDDADLHEYAADILMAGPRWADLSVATLRHDAAATLRRIRSRVVLLAREDDGPAADVEPLAEHCTVERVGPQLSAWRTALLSLLKRASLPSVAWRPPAASGNSSARAGEQRHYVNLVHGQVGLRFHGRAGDSPPLLLLPDVPGGAASTRRLAASLADERLTVSPELPGLGESHPLPYPTLGSFTTVLHEVLEALDIPIVDIVAEGLGCCFGVALAAHQSRHVRRLAMDGVPMIRARDRRRIARHYCPTIEADRYGAYLQRLWLQRRDAETCWPWFDRSADGIRKRNADLDAPAMHEDFVAAMQHLPGYGDAARAALESSLRDILPAVRQPTLLFDVPGDGRYAGVSRAARRLPSAEVKPRPADPGLRAGLLREFLA